MFRGTRRGIAALTVAMALGGCAQGHLRVAPAAAASPTTSTRAMVSGTSPTAPAGPTLVAVHRTMAGVHSYAYRAVTTTTPAGGSPATTSTFTGSIVTPDRVSYSATTGRRSFDVVRIGAASYRRDQGGTWTKLPIQKITPALPTSTLLAILDHLTSVTISPTGAVAASLSPQDANDTGLASGPGITTALVVALPGGPGARFAAFL